MPVGSEAPRIVVISPRASLATALQAALAHCLPNASLQWVDHYPRKADLVPLLGPGSWCFLDVEAEPALAMQLAAVWGSGQLSSPLVAVLEQNDAQLILQSLRQGCTEFLLAPFPIHEVQLVLQRLAGLGDASSPQSRVILFIPGKGASGASTLCANLALLHSRMDAGKLLLADLDPLAGTIGFLLRLKSPYSFMDALSRVDSLDEDLWRGLVVHTQGFDVLLAPENPADVMSQLPDPAPLIRFAQRLYDTLLVDCGGVFLPMGIQLARLASEIVLVTTNELPALEATQKALAYLDEQRIDRNRIRLVLNRFAERSGLTRQAVASALHLEIFQTIPNDYDGVQRAIVEGRGVSPNSPVGKAIAALADRLAGREPVSEEAAVRKPWLGFLSSLFSKAPS